MKSINRYEVRWDRYAWRIWDTQDQVWVAAREYPTEHSAQTAADTLNQEELARLRQRGATHRRR
ncbi:MAG TPA: hypothetical protein VGW38_15465 [Chloroflexota bacterium]|nr:hypothetical protein [Chloroflexota bacterium]